MKADLNGKVQMSVAESKEFRRLMAENKAKAEAKKNECKHGADVYNCYEGCYDEMKNGTVS